MATIKQLPNGANNNAKNKRLFTRVLKKMEFCCRELDWFSEQFEKAKSNKPDYGKLRMHLASIDIAMDALKISLACDFESLLHSLPVDESIDG